MTLKKAKLYFNTLKYLRWRQISYRLWYFLRNRWRKTTRFQYDLGKSTPLSKKTILEPSIAAPTSFSSEKGFTFLNLSQKFDNSINWEFADYGKLWTYNLTYFEFLNQNAQNTEGSPFPTIIEDFIKKLPQLKMRPNPSLLLYVASIG